VNKGKRAENDTQGKGLVRNVCVDSKLCRTDMSGIDARIRPQSVEQIEMRLADVRRVESLTLSLMNEVALHSSLLRLDSVDPRHLQNNTVRMKHSVEEFWFRICHVQEQTPRRIRQFPLYEMLKTLLSSGQVQYHKHEAAIPFQR